MPPIRRLFLWLVLAAAISLPARAEPVRMGCVEFPPLTFTGPDGRPAGKVVDLVARVMDKAGLQVQVSPCYPGARLMASLRDGSVHVAVLIRHPEIVDHTLYGTMPLTYLELDAFHRAGRANLRGMGDLRGKSVILLRGYGYGGWVDYFKDPANRMHLSFADSHQAALRMLASGHGDYLVDYRDPAAQALAESPIPGLRRDSLTRLEVYFVVSRLAPESAELLKRLEGAFKALGGKPVD